MTYRRSLWLDFCRRYALGPDCPPLFESDNGIVSTVPLGRKQAPVLERSKAMEQQVIGEVELILDDYRNHTELYEGLIYCMFELDHQRLPLPLYIGKAEKYGKNNGNLSANIQGVKLGSRGPFARWGYNYAYHLGDLSSVVLSHPDGATKKYERWANELFDKPYRSRKLKRPIYFWCKAWETGAVGPWPDFGPTNLTFLEYLLIGIASSDSPRILNSEGVNRGAHH